MEDAGEQGDREASTSQRVEGQRNVGKDLGDLKDLLGDAYEKVDGMSDISWGSDAGDDADTVAPDPVATRMLRAESEDERAVQDVMKEVEQLRVLLGDSKQQSGEALQPAPQTGHRSASDGKFSDQNEVDRLLAEDAKQGVQFSFNPSVNQRMHAHGTESVSGQALADNDETTLVPPSKRIRREVTHDSLSGADIGVAGNPSIENVKWGDPVGGGKYGSIIGSQSQRSFQGLDFEEMRSDANLSVKSRGGRRAGSKMGDGCNRSIKSADFDGLLSESHGPSMGKSREECNRSICTADFEGLVSERGGLGGKQGRSITDDGNRSIRTADFEGLMSEANGSARWVKKDDGNCSIRTGDFDGLLSEPCNGGKLEIDTSYAFAGEPGDADKKEPSEINSDDKIDLNDVLNGALPRNLARKNIIIVLENVLNKNCDLQLELEATLESIDVAIDHNAKASQVARALMLMKHDNGKIARPRSSCVLDEGRPVVVNNTVQTSYWSNFNGKHPEINKDTQKMQTLMKFMPIQHRFNASWTLREEDLLRSGLAAYVQELCMESALGALEKQQQNGTDVSMGTARNIISELGSLTLESPVALDIISRFTKAQWQHVAKTYVDRRSGFECLLQWNCFTRPDKITSKFSKREMMKIRLMSNELCGRNWVKIAKELKTGRSPAECFRAHMQSLALPAVVWNRDEDEKLAALVEQHGTEQWDAIGFELGRTSRACQCRFKDVLMLKNGTVTLKKTKNWDFEDDLNLLKAVRKYGKRWREIACITETRTPVAVKNRYICHIDPTADLTPFSPEEKQQILELGREEYKKLGRIRWTELTRRLTKKRQMRTVRMVYIKMMKAVEQDEDPFAVQVTVRKTDVESRMRMNIDGSPAVWSDDDMEIDPTDSDQRPDLDPFDGLPSADDLIGGKTCSDSILEELEENSEGKREVEKRIGVWRKGFRASEMQTKKDRASKKRSRSV
ncbi:hypothetical protein BSKO_10826 [Bryopsis sp. KO-2023]|nr:hypothetical protein BSKO_10826 [Bryopsis sp. KO-2023]